MALCVAGILGFSSGSVKQKVEARYDFDPVKKEIIVLEDGSVWEADSDTCAEGDEVVVEKDYRAELDRLLRHHLATSDYIQQSITFGNQVTQEQFEAFLLGTKSGTMTKIEAAEVVSLLSFDVEKKESSETTSIEMGLCVDNLGNVYYYYPDEQTVVDGWQKGDSMTAIDSGEMQATYLLNNTQHEAFALMKLGVVVSEVKEFSVDVKSGIMTADEITYDLISPAEEVEFSFDQGDKILVFATDSQSLDFSQTDELGGEVSAVEPLRESIGGLESKGKVIFFWNVTKKQTAMASFKLAD
ncbi:MAG: hypothetical protein S4CHLAM102_11950 [Chlamydiia bacterium]|nr:hypothetical protein [Chlamydiia bacterium]